MSPQEKWELLGPFLLKHGREALSYATLQQGMEYFICPLGYIAFTSVTHPVFARKTRRMVLSDPLCAPEDLRELVRQFLEFAPGCAFVVVSEQCAGVLRELGFRANCLGYEPELPIQTYNTKGNWKELDLIKRARNEAKREGIVIREASIENINREELDDLTRRWIGSKKVNDHEIWVYARRPVYGPEPDVRKFVAFEPNGHVAGYVFYDPMYRDGKVFGYSANISRCDEKRFGRLATAIHMTAMEQFKAEGRESLNLCLAPFVNLGAGKYNDDGGTSVFLKASERFGNNIYNFKGLAFHKSKYRGAEKSLYFASNNFLPSNDIYLAFLSSDITRSYFATVGRLLWGIATGLFSRQRT